MPPVWLEWFVVVVLVIWFTGTLAYQLFFHQLAPLTQRFDLFRLLIGWRLFSATPRDLRLWYRDQDANGADGPWREIPMRRSRRWHRAVWNPDFVGPDALLTFVDAFVTLLPKLTPEELRRKPTTLALWLVAHAQPQTEGDGWRQFELREVSLNEPDEVRALYTSELQPAGTPGVPS